MLVISKPSYCSLQLNKNQVGIPELRKKKKGGGGDSPSSKNARYLQYMGKIVLAFIKPFLVRHAWKTFCHGVG